MGWMVHDQDGLGGLLGPQFPFWHISQPHHRRKGLQIPCNAGLRNGFTQVISVKGTVTSRQRSCPRTGAARSYEAENQAQPEFLI